MDAVRGGAPVRDGARADVYRFSLYAPALGRGPGLPVLAAVHRREGKALRLCLPRRGGGRRDRLFRGLLENFCNGV